VLKTIYICDEKTQTNEAATAASVKCQTKATYDAELSTHIALQKAGVPVPLLDDAWVDKNPNPTMGFIVMQAMEDPLKVDLKMSIKERLTKYGPKLIAAMDLMHKAGFLHRDLKIDNVMVDSAAGDPKLIDFGLTVAITEELTATTGCMNHGTGPYANPGAITIHIQRSEANDGSGKVVWLKKASDMLNKLETYPLTLTLIEMGWSERIVAICNAAKVRNAALPSWVNIKTKDAGPAFFQAIITAGKEAFTLLVPPDHALHADVFDVLWKMLNVQVTMAEAHDLLVAALKK